MTKRFQFNFLALMMLAVPVSALADISSTATLSSGNGLSLDTGTVTNSSPDLLYSGGNIAPQGKATAFNVGNLGSSFFGTITQSTLTAFVYSSAPIQSASLVTGDIFAVKTNAGNYAKVLVTAAGGGSLTLQYTTFGATSGGGGGGGGAPTVTAIQNNYSYIVPGLPNYGIAPGALFIVKGSNLSDPVTPTLQSSAAPGLPLTLNNTSISVTVNGTTTQPALYYTSAGQLAAVLPSKTPAGTGTLTVTYKGVASAPAQIQVVASALGLDSIYGTGAGLGVATIGANVLGYTTSAKPGDTIVLWGSGVGADTSNDDRTYPLNQNNLTNIPMQVYVGGVSATITYRGRSQYPGVDQVDVVIPQSVTPGCAVSVVAVSGSIVSNTVTLPVAAGGGTCSDSNYGITGDQLISLSNLTNANSGSLSINQFFSSQGAFSGANGAFQSIQGGQFGSAYGLASFGSCIILPPTPPGTNTPFTFTGLDAGNIPVTSPSGAVQQLQTNQFTGAGLYAAQLPAGFIPNAGGTFTFAGSGGKDVGAFSNASITFPNPILVWSNQSSITSVTRSAGVTITWTGGSNNTDVAIIGSSTANNVSVGFICISPVAPGQFTVPSYVLLALPAGNGSLSIANAPIPTSFTASGLNYGTVTASTTYTSSPSYQ